MDFSDLGGTPISTGPGPDFSDLGGVPVHKDEGSLAAAARGALRNVPFGQQAAAAAAPINPLAEKKTYGEELQHLTEKAEEAKAEHPIAYGAGAAAGTAAPLAIPVVGESLEAAPFAANAALGAVNAASDINLTKPPTKEQVTDVGTQALLAGGLGKAFSGIGKLLGTGKEAAPEIAAEAAPKVAGGIPKEEIAGIAVPSKKVAPEFTPSAERVYASQLAQGLGGTPRQLMKVFGKENPIKAMNELGEWMDTAGPGGQSLHGLTNRPGELLEKMDTIHDTSGKTIGDIIQSLGEEHPNAAKIQYPIVDRPDLLKELHEFALNTIDPATESRINKLITTVQREEAKNTTDFELVQKLKEMVGHQIAKDPEMSPIYGSLSERLQKLIADYGNAIQDPNLKALYDKARLDYHNSSRLLPMLRYVEGRELVGGPAGHFSLRGLLSTIVNIAGAAGGIPPTEQLGRNVMLKTAPTLKRAIGIRNQAPGRLAPLAAQELANVLENKYGRQKNALRTP